MMQEYLINKGFKLNDYMTYNNQGELILATSYVQNNTLVIIDHNSIFEIDFDYKRYCQKQNEWMNQYERIYRFIKNDIESIKLFLDEVNDFDNNYSSRRTYDRELTAIDPTPIESFFEDRFADAYGEEAYKYLAREYSVICRDGITGYMDYVMFHNSGRMYAVEENGVSYHHPFIIKEERYKSILMKQNSVVYNGGKVFRWDTQSMQNPDRIVDEIKEFFGDIKEYIIQSSISASRNFCLYNHQTEHIKELSSIRESGMNASLVVLPTGTGKTKIAIEDLSELKIYNKDFRALILVPSLDLKRQWIKDISVDDNLINNVEIATYSGIYQRYNIEVTKKYNYIIVDEAHHSVAPTLRKVLRYYQPEFLLGLTATDKRLDEKKLESVFGKYDIKLDLKEAIEGGILCQIRAFRLMTNIDLTKVRFNNLDYYSSDLEKNILVPSRNEIIADTVEKYFSDTKLSDKCGIIFCVNITHTKMMAKLLNDRGINAAAIDGKDKKRFQKIDLYMKKKIRFLCTCSLLTEGWDAPHTSVIVMARPTLSKVLYTQQLGRGTRNYPSKEALYVIDVVDNYGVFGNVSNRPWSIHSLFESQIYKPFGNVVDRGFDGNEELVVLDSIYEKEMKLAPIDVFTMQQLYSEYLSVEQLARELFVSTGTVKSWITKKRIEADISVPMLRKRLDLFSLDSVGEIRKKMGLKEHTEETIVEDFWEFIDKGDYTFSYKMYFILALMKMVNSSGDAGVDDVVEQYQEYYLERYRENRIIDRSNSPYNDRENVEDRGYMKRSMLGNPFEKFERKRFLYHAKDLKEISVHHRIWEELISDGGMERIESRMRGDLVEYYGKLEEREELGSKGMG